MKNFTKQFANKALFKPTRWLLVALMFILGTSGAWAATVTFTSDDILYFDMSAVSWWTAGTNGNGNFAYFYNNSTSKNAWSAHAVQYSGSVYYVKIPAGTWEGVILTRNNTSTAPSWDNKWNQTGDIALSSTSNYISKFSEGSASVTWGTQKPTSTGALTASSTSVNTNTNVTLTPSLTSNTTYNEIKSTTYAISPSTGASINGNTFTATAAGTYTVTATITYNPRGYSSLTSTVKPTTTITVTAPVVTYTISYNNNGGTGTIASQTKTKGTPITLSNGSGFSKTGYTLDSWNTNSAGSGTKYALSASYTTDAALTLYAQWKINTYTITYNANNGSGAPAAQTKTYGETLTLSSTKPTRTGYTFQNWNTKADGTGTTYASGASYTANAAATLYAQWKADTYAIKYDANGGEGAPSQQTKIYGQNLTLSSTVPTRTGYTFQNWNTKADGSGTSYAKGGTYTTNAAATLYAQWKANQYTITYKDQGGANFSGTHANGYPTTHTYGTATELKTATKAGYTFGGWFTTSACTGSAVTSLGATAYIANITLYAKWEKSCITVETPDIDPVAICAGSTATLTLKNKQNDVIYKIGDTPIFTDGTTHTVKPDRTTTYTITATSENSCDAGQKETTTVQVEVKDLPDPPAISSGTTVCPNTQFSLPTIDGKWYAQEEGGSAYGSNIITKGVAATTYYYAEAVKYGCSSATRTKYTVNVHTAPVAPVITLNPATVGQDRNSVLSISNETYSPSNTKYELYKGNTKVGEMTAQTTNVSSSDVGSVKYTVKATHKECTALTSTSNEVTLTVQEAGATIASLGDLKIDAQDPVDFVAMYVKNDGLSDYTDQGATSVTGYTWQFSSDDGKTWTNCASTNTVAGVNYALGMENGSVNCNNFRPNVAGKYRCVVKYDVGEQPSNILTVTADGSTAKTFKGVTMTLPVISVNTGASSFPVNNFGGTPSKNADKMKEKISVDVKIFENINGTTQVVYDRKARMNYRGSSSLNFLKKSYAFCPGDEICGDKKGIDYVKTKKLNMLGIGSAKDKDWVLYAAAADPSLMRNRLVFDTFADMTGGWSVSSRYVELVVNGEYKGVYVMMDKITANKDRVNVEWKLDANGNTTQEAFIVKFDKTDRADRYENTSGDQKTFKSKYSGHDGFDTYDTNIDQRFEVEYPEKEDIEDGKGKWSEVFNAIENKINKFEEELAKGNFSEVQKLIDYTSWADWFIITEFAKNIDGYRASNIFVYDGSKANAKIEARPLWDQELSFNNQCPSYYADYGSNSTSGLLIDKSNSAVYNNDASAPFWFTGKYKGDRGKYNGSDQTFKGLLDDPCFQAEVQARWAKHIGANGALTSSALTTKMTGYLKDLDKNHDLSSSAITSGTPLDREFNTFWKNKSRATIDCGTGSGCYSGTTGYTDPTFHNSKVSLNNWLTGNRRTNLGNIINGWKGTELNITLTITPETGITTPWEAVMVQVNNPSGYDYDLEYTTNTLDKVSGVIINENNDKYTYRIPRPEAWKPGDEEKDGERTDIQYGIKATLKVGEGVAQCGNSSQAPSATTTITLQDEDNENCQK